MDIKINEHERIIAIVGPTCSGKTTLANRIKESSSRQTVIISHDQVLATINPNQSQKAIDDQFRLKLLEEIVSAINDESNECIILDTLNIRQSALFAFLSVITRFSTHDSIVVLKVFPSLTQHLNNLEERNKSETEKIPKNLLINQRNFFKGPSGSLHAKFPRCSEHIIYNLKNINIIV